MGRTWAIIERELRRFRRSPVLIVMALFMPIVQLVVLGYAFGGNVKHLKLAIVDQDHGVPAVRVRELASAASNGAHTIDTIDYADQGQAISDLRNGRVNGVLTIPTDFSRRVLAKNEPRVALIEDNTDGFVSVAMAGTLGGILQAYSLPSRGPRIASAASLDVVEIYPYVPYVQYLLPGSVVMSIFMMVMIGGGIIFIDDKARGLHEGYLVTPIKKLELIAGFNISGTIKAVLAGMFLLIIGSLIAGIPNAFDPMRLLRLFVVVCVTSFALISLMFLLMVRVSDPLLPRAVFGVLNTVLYFPSGAVYPQQGFPAWMQVIAVADPFTYAVHAFKSLLLKNTGFGAISYDLTFLHDFLGRLARCRDGLVQTVVVTVTRDVETRERLLKAAERLFADRGFKKVTVRDICRAARANVAAVNYHFGDKLGLYREVMQSAIDGMRGTNDAAREAGDGQPPEEQLRRYIAIFVHRLLTPGNDTVHKLVNREMNDPTPALDALVEQGVRPRVEYLSGLIAAIIGCAPTEQRVLRCVASVQSQTMSYLPNPIAARLGLANQSTAANLDEIAEHIADFSLAGVHAVGRGVHAR